MRLKPPADRPTQPLLTRHAEKDLLSLPDDVRQRVKADLLRLAGAQIPFSQLKKLRGFTPPIWQLTSGRFRVIYRREEERLLILRVVAKPDQKDLFRSPR